MCQKIDISNEYYRKCPECGIQFMANHINRKYCYNIKCKTKFNNRKTKDRMQSLKGYLQSVLHNVKILKVFYESKQFEVDVPTLKMEKFSFEKFTERKEINDTRVYETHYGNFILRPIQKDKFQILIK